MDLARFITVAWRHRLLLSCGLLIAVMLMLASVARLVIVNGTPAIQFREDNVYLSSATALVTQDGFPWGRATLDEMIEIRGTDGAQPTLLPRFGDVQRYAGLAAIYVELAKADEIRRTVLAGAPRGARYEPVILKAGGGEGLPLISFVGYGPTGEAAQNIAVNASKEFRRFLAAEQRRNGIPQDKRVEVMVTQQATPATIFEKRSYIKPVFLFLLVCMGFVALAFGVDNLRSGRAAAEAARKAEPGRPAEKPVRAA